MSGSSATPRLLLLRKYLLNIYITKYTVRLLYLIHLLKMQNWGQVFPLALLQDRF